MQDQSVYALPTEQAGLLELPVAEGLPLRTEYPR